MKRYTRTVWMIAVLATMSVGLNACHHMHQRHQARHHQARHCCQPQYAHHGGECAYAKGEGAGCCAAKATCPHRGAAAESTEAKCAHHASAAECKAAGCKHAAAPESQPAEQ